MTAAVGDHHRVRLVCLSMALLAASAGLSLALMPLYRFVTRLYLLDRIGGGVVPQGQLLFWGATSLVINALRI